MDVEKALNSKILEDQVLVPIHEAGVTRDFFIDEENRKVWDWINNYWRDEGLVPTTRALQHAYPTYRVDVDVEESLDWLIDQIRKQRKRDLVIEILAETGDALSSRDGEEEALRLLSAGLSEIHTEIPVLADEHLIETYSARAERYRELAESTGELAGLPTSFPAIDRATNGLQPEQLVTLIGQAKAGKAQPLYSKVLTPMGWTTIGSLSMGDEVVGSDGRPTRVVAVHPQGSVPIYRVGLSDGSSVEACGEHLWKVRDRNKIYKTLTTLEVQDLLDEGMGRNLYLPTVSPVEFRSEPLLPVEPYLLGVLLGDGCLRGGSVTLTTEDPEILEKAVAGLPEGMRTTPQGRYGHALVFSKRGQRIANPLVECLESLGLMGRLSWEKHIPEDYLRASIADRRCLLQGLLDTDGWIEGNRSIVLSTSSPRLRDGVVELIQSLGGTCKVAEKTTPHRLAYVIRMRLPSSMGSPFALPRKRERWERDLPSVRRREPLRRIVSVTYVGCREAQCITVDAPDALYVTENYTVTHNSWIAIRIAKAVSDLGLLPMFVSFEMSVAEQAARFDAMCLECSATNLMSGHSTPHQRKRLKRLWRERRSENRDVLISSDINAVTTLSGLAAKIETNRPDLVVVDGAYLMDDEHSDSRTSESERLTRLTRGLKRLAQQRRVPILVTTQALQSKTRRGRLDQNSGGYTSSFQQDSDVLLGVEKPEDEDSKMVVRVIASRNSGKVDIGVEVDWDTSRFIETGEEIGEEEFG